MTILLSVRVPVLSEHSCTCNQHLCRHNGQRFCSSCVIGGSAHAAAAAAHLVYMQLAQTTIIAYSVYV